MWQKGAESGVCEMVQEQMTCSPQRVSTSPPSDQPGNSSPPRATPAGEKGRPTGSGAGGATPPAEAFAACTGKSARAACEFTWQKGSETGVCEMVQGQMICSPRRVPGANPPSGAPRSQPGDAPDASTGAAYNIEQAISDKAQGMTIAFDALAFLTGDLGSDSFFPPGKVADYWGFQCLRDNDPSQMGHAGDFLTSAAMNMLNTLTADQRAELVALAKSQVDSINEYGYKGMLDWPKVAEPADIRGLDRDVKVAVMTYAADMYSWYAGSVDADVYFCPERHGTYFGSFYLKDIPAMSDSAYAIPTNLTGDMGEDLLRTLTADQAQLITSLVDVQQPSLTSLVEVRKQVSTELRKFKDGSALDEAAVLSLMKEYGAYDGEIIYNMAVHFSEVGRSLTDDQKSQLLALRKEMLGDRMRPSGAYLYSQAIAMPEIPNTDFLFE
jgi:hypothetical protein